MTRNKALIALLACIIIIPLIYFLLFPNKPKVATTTQPISTVTNLTATLVNKQEYPHDTLAFTEGLEFVGDKLVEGTGDYGKSFIAETDLATNKTIIKHRNNNTDFGEGITVLNGRLYQLTYKEGKAYQYNYATMKLEKTFPLTPEGWGMTNDGKSLIVSNGTADITYYNPITFTIEKKIQVSDNMGLRNNINELEYVDGSIYANIYTTNTIIKFDAQTGKIQGSLDASFIANKLGNNKNIDVMNGIAYNKATKTFFITGKLWPKIFEVTIQ